MGISKAMVSLLAECRRDLGLDGAILELGKQDIHLDLAQLRGILAKFGLPAPASDTAAKIDDVDVFKALGFHTVESMDANAYEGANHIHDMNQPVPDSLKGRYDVVYDGGTLEHIFNFPQSLKNIFDLLKPGGVIIHASPSHNHVDHGFYMFSPTVFYEYYTENKFKILKSYIYEYPKDHARKDWLIYDYKPGSIDHLAFGGWGRKLLGIFLVAQKVPATTNGGIPQQGTYLRVWTGMVPQEAGIVHERKEAFGLKLKVQRALDPYPMAYKLVARLYRTLRRNRRVVKRY